jgi:hypothetical protein
MYWYEEGIFGLGTNGSKDAPIERPTFPSGATTQQEMDEFLRQQAAWNAGQQAQRTAQQTERSAALTRSLDDPAAQIGLCAAGALPWGALLGALSSPKGERGGGAKWGILASMATCPLVPVWRRLGVFGTVMNMALAWVAPILAAKYRLKRKEQRGELPARTY